VNENTSFALNCSGLDVFGIDIIWYLNENPINSSNITIGPNGNLWFSKVSTLDQGNYTCGLKNGNWTPVKTFGLIVNVTESSEEFQEKIKLLFVSPKTLIAHKDKDFKIFCIYGGTSLPKIIWKFNGSNFNGTKNVNLENGGKILKFTKVSLENAGNYSCEVYNESFSHSMELKVGSAPYPFHSEDVILNGTQNESIQINCPIEGFDEIKWTFNGEDVESGEKYQMVDSTLRISGLTLSDTGVYACNTSNSWGFLHKEKIMNVFMPTKINVASKNYTSLVGETVLLNVTVEHDPSATPVIHWYKNETLIESGGRFQKSDYSLEISNLTLTDSGNYTIEVKTEHEGKIQEIISLLVEDPPRLPKKTGEDPLIVCQH
jgi:hypothetical protein